MDRLTDDAMVNLPMPEFTGALKNFTVDELTGNGYVIVLALGFVQLVLAHVAEAAVMLEVMFDGLLGPVKSVDEIVRLQPGPVPLASFTVNPSE